MSTRRVRAERRVVPICYPDGEQVGFVVLGWHPGQLPLGPFTTSTVALAAALENTENLARGQQLRQERAVMPSTK